MKTPVKCLECDLTNWSTDEFCKRCRASLHSVSVDMPIPKPTSVPENSFADLYSPDYEADVFPSHSQTPQMAARINAQKNLSEAEAVYKNFTELKKTRSETHRQSPPLAYSAAPPIQPAKSLPPSVKLKSGLAIASMILGIIGFLTAIILVGFLFAVVGLILGIVALLKIHKNPRVYGGKPFAITGIAVSSLVMLLLPVIAAIAIPNLLAARRSANEASAISSIRALSSAQNTFMQTKQVTRCGELQTLEREGLVDSELAKGEKNGYRFLIVNSPFGGCEITAKPVSSSTGTRDFYYSTEDNQLRAGDRNGQPIA